MFFQNYLIPETVKEAPGLIAEASQAAIKYAPQVIFAIFSLLTGFWIIGRLTHFLSKVLNRTLETSLSKFLASTFNIALKIMLFLSVATMFGVNTTSFVAIISALMVGVGMALNGSLGHLASGIMIMVFKPFKVGDLVEVGGGHLGVVLAINAFNTTLSTIDNKRIIVANSNVTGNTITNITGQGIVGVELTFGIGYKDSIDKARDIILQVGEVCPYIIDNPPQRVVVAELADSSVNLATRPFCKSEDYWDARFYMIENVKKEFDKAGVGIPFPQLDIHMIK